MVTFDNYISSADFQIQGVKRSIQTLGFISEPKLSRFLFVY